MKTKLLFFGVFLLSILYTYAQPANNDCANAETITVSFLSATNVSYDPSTATQSLQSSCDNAGTTYNDVWYTFTMPNAGNIQIVDAGNTERFALYDACGGNEIDCFSGSDYFLGLTATTYYLRVSKTDGVATADNFTINTFEIPANDECANAEVITDDLSVQQSYSFDNRGATESLDATCDASSQTHLDIWYEFTMPFNGNIHITGVNVFDRFSLYDSCGGAEITCSSDDTFAYSLSSGTTYLLRVHSRSIYASVDSFNIQAFPTVANNDCANAEVITDNITTQRTITYDNRGATESVSTSCDNVGNPVYLDVWYEFNMPVDGNLVISGVNIFDRFTLYDSCGGMEIICDNDDVIAYNLTMGTYLLRVSKQDIYASADSFNMQAFEGVANDECVNAEVITEDITTQRTITYDNRGASESLDASCDAASQTHLDVWYEFTMPVDGNLQISGVSIFDEFTFYDSCGGTELACFIDDGFVYNLTIGTYFLRAYTRDVYASTESFNIQAFATVVNDECATAEVIADITTQQTINFDNRNATESLDASCDTASNTYLDVWYQFTMPFAGNLSISGVNTFDRFTVYDSCGGSEVACFNDDTYLYNLPVGTYFLRAYSQTIYASEDSFNIQAFAAVSNDTCATAEVITDDIATQRTINFDNRGATAGVDASCDSAGTTYLDVWYEFTMPFQGNIEISGVNIFDNFTIYDSCGGSEIACFTDDELIFNLSPGTFYVRAYSRELYAEMNSFNIQAFEALPNDDCANAQLITVSDIFECTSQNVTFDTRSSSETAAPNIGSCFNATETWLDAWYTFVAPLTGNVILRAGGGPINMYAVYEGCGGNEVACFTTSGVIPVTLGTTYHIQVARSTNVSTQGPITFCLEAAPAIAPGIPGVCESIPDVEISAAQGNTSGYVPILDASGNIVAAIFPSGNDLGTVSTTLFIENADTRDFSGQPYLRREVSISTATFSGFVGVVLYMTQDEVDDLILADSNLSDALDLEVMRVDGTTCTAGYTAGGDFLPANVSPYLDGYLMTCVINESSVLYPTSTMFSGTLSVPSIENNKLGITVIPTVTTGIVNLKTDQILTDVAVHVVDITGRSIYQTTFENLNQTQQSVDLSKYQSGMYFMKITHQNTEVTKRIILK
jgi:hypothetical protein